MKYITAIFFTIIIIFSFNNSKADLMKLDVEQDFPNIKFYITDREILNFHKYLEKNKLNFVIINFWATWCLPCVTELPSLNELAVSNEFKNFEIWAVSVERGNSLSLSKFLEQKGGRNLKFAQDKKWEVGKKLNIQGIPVTIIIKKINTSLKIVSRHSGSLDWNSEKLIKQLKKIILN